VRTLLCSLAVIAWWLEGSVENRMWFGSLDAFHRLVSFVVVGGVAAAALGEAAAAIAFFG